MSIDELSSQWLLYKAAEADAIAKRREIEDALVRELSIREDQEGVSTFVAGNLQLKVTGRMDRKVDADKLQELAAEYGLTEHLSSLFRWKPDVNMAAWKAAAPSITQPLLAAITTKPGRPSFSIKE